MFFTAGIPEWQLIYRWCWSHSEILILSGLNGGAFVGTVERVNGHTVPSQPGYIVKSGDACGGVCSVGKDVQAYLYISL